MNEERIIDKIRKVLELSKNNPSEEEAKAAALKAQKLLAQYHISMEDIEDVSKIEDVVEERVDGVKGCKWKTRLANIVARNFSCKTFRYGSSSIVFYGHETDAKVAANTFKMLFKIGHSKGLKARATAKKEGYSTSGIYNSYVCGFVDGVKTELEKQCTALMIVVPQDVENAYAERSNEIKIRTITITRSGSDYGNEVRSQAVVDGRTAMQATAIAG